MNLWKSLNKLPRELWILSIATLINRSGTMVLPFMAIYLNKGLHFSITESGLVLTVYGIAALITAPLVGKLVDWLHPFRVMKFSLVMSGLLLFLFPCAKHYYEILILTFIWSSLNEAFRPANLVLIGSLSAHTDRRLAFALNRLAINLGMSIGPAVGGFLFIYDYSLIFYVDGAAHLLSWLFLIFVKISFDKTPETGKEEAGSTTTDVMQNILKKRLFYFLIAFVPVILVFFQTFSTFPIFLTKDLNLGASTYGLIFTLNTVMIIFIEVPLLNYLANHSNLKLMSVGSILVALGFGSMIFAKNIPMILGTVVLWTFGEMIIFPSSAAYVSEISPENKRGQYMGYYQTANNAAFTMGPWLGTLAYENLGASYLWAGTFVLAMISAVSIRILSRKSSEELRMKN